MTRTMARSACLLLLGCALTACEITRLPQAQTISPGVLTPIDLTGAWRASVRFEAGALAGAEDLQFLYAYHADGTMTESSNYDATVTPSPPSYGVWRRTGPRQFEARYIFFRTRPSGARDGKEKGTGLLPAGYGIMTEVITLSADGNGYTSTVTATLVDSTGTPVEGGGKGTGSGSRIVFPTP